MSIAHTWFGRSISKTAQQIRIDLVSRLRLGRPRTAIQRFYPHPPHQRLHVPTADLAPLGSQQPSQHPRAGEWELQMQLVEMPHDREVGVRHRPRQVVDAATADAQNLRLPGDRQIVLTVDHRFALSNPALVSAPSKKSFSNVSSPILACSDFTSTAGWRRDIAAPWTEHRSGGALKLSLPRGDLIGVDVELLGQLRQRPIALDGGKRHLCLEGRCVVPARSSAHALS